jgi:hypothetical protein
MDDTTRARLALARDAWDAALLRGDYAAADDIAAEVAELEADAARGGFSVPG